MADDNRLLLVIAGTLLALAGLVSSLARAGKATKPKVPQIPAGKPVTGLPASPSPAPTVSGLDFIYQKWANIRGLDWLLVKAVAQVESDEQPAAVNPNDPSYGLMQILCVQSSPTGHCRNRFPAIPNWDEATQEKLVSDPDYNVDIGTQILKWNLDAYGFPRGIAVYNRWASRNDPEQGPFGNQEYVDKVLAKLAALQGGRS